MLLEKLSGLSCPPVHGESFAVTMTSGRCGSRKLYASKQPWCMHSNFRNAEFFENIDAGEGLRPLNPPKSLAGSISMPCGAHAFIHMTRRVVAP